MKTVVTELVSRDGTLKVQIYRRDAGTYGFDEWRFSDEPREHCWIPHGRPGRDLPRLLRELCAIGLL